MPLSCTARALIWQRSSGPNQPGSPTPPTAAAPLHRRAPRLESKLELRAVLRNNFFFYDRWAGVACMRVHDGLWWQGLLGRAVGRGSWPGGGAQPPPAERRHALGTLQP